MKKQRIVLIGPVYPYKTGLSYYVGLLYKELCKTADVTLFSYSLQYPKILYKKPQKNYDDDLVKVEDAKFELNSANPLSWCRLARKINRLKPDLVLFQWLHPYFAPCYWSITKMLKHTKVLYICHNAVPHERFLLDRFLTKMTLKQADGIISHAKSDEQILREMLPNMPIRVNPHPAYQFFNITNMSRETAREILKIESETRVLLFFGLIRAYKGLKYLLDAMPEIVAGLGRVKLLIAGDFSEDKQVYLDRINELHINEYVDIYAGHIPVPEVEKFFSACNIVVLPYESATQSGVIQTAYGFRRPVLATNVGGLPDAVEDMRTGYIVEPKNPSAIAEKVVDFFERRREAEFSAHIEEAAERFSWERMAETIKELIE